MLFLASVAPQKTLKGVVANSFTVHLLLRNLINCLVTRVVNGKKNSCKRVQDLSECCVIKSNSYVTLRKGWEGAVSPTALAQNSGNDDEQPDRPRAIGAPVFIPSPRCATDFP
jgi:hypothetical protein